MRNNVMKNLVQDGVDVCALSLGQGDVLLQGLLLDVRLLCVPPPLPSLHSLSPSQTSWCEAASAASLHSLSQVKVLGVKLSLLTPHRQQDGQRGSFSPPTHSLPKQATRCIATSGLLACWCERAIGLVGSVCVWSITRSIRFLLISDSHFFEEEKS